MSKDIKELTKRRLNFLQTLKAVFWGLFGVRKGKGYDKDKDTLNPVHLIITGLIVVIVFVVGLVALANGLVSYFSQSI